LATVPLNPKSAAIDIFLLAVKLALLAMNSKETIGSRGTFAECSLDHCTIGCALQIKSNSAIYKDHDWPCSPALLAVFDSHSHLPLYTLASFLSNGDHVPGPHGAQRYTN
jgi:hypothetical protein